MSSTTRVAVVVGSTRPTRICPDIAGWACDTLRRIGTLDYRLLDLADVALPLLDEPLMAALGRYEHAHTKAWSAQVRSYDGFLFVHPQYNWGYPAVLKNALDYLYDEWRDRPVTQLSYGTRGGSRAATQLDGVLHGLHMRVLATRIEAVVTEADVDDDYQLVDAGRTLAPTLDALAAVDAEMSAALSGSGAPAVRAEAG